MDQKGIYFRVGAVLLVGIGLLVALIVWVGSDSLRRRGDTFETYFSESVQGLDVGSPLKFRGVTVGSVRSIEVANAIYNAGPGPRQPFQRAFTFVVVRFDVFSDRFGADRNEAVSELIRRGLRVRMASQGITGVMYLEADFVDPTRFVALTVPWTPVFPHIPAIPSTLTQFQSSAERLLARLEETDVVGLVQGASRLLALLDESLRTGELYRVFVEGADLLAGVRQTVDGVRPSLESAARETQALAASARQIVEGREIRQLLANSAAASAELRTALTRLPQTAASIEQTMRRVEALAADGDRDLGPILRDLRVTADNLRALTEQARQYPSQVLFGSPPPRDAPARRNGQ